MQFADFDSVLYQCAECLLRLFKLNRQMTSVVIDTKMLSQPRIAAMLLPHPLEEIYSLHARLKNTKRLRLETQMQFAPRLFTDSRNMVNGFPDILSNHLQLLLGRNQFLEPARNRADTSFNIRRHELRQQ